MEEDGKKAFLAVSHHPSIRCLGEDFKDNEQESETYKEPAVASWEITKLLMEKEEFGNRRGPKRQKGNQAEKNSFVFLGADLAKPLDSQTKQLQCPVCGEILKYKSQFNIHLRVHTGGKPYKCMHCGKSFSQKAHLHSHQKTHTGEKPYKCMECGKSFSHNGNLHIHQKTSPGANRTKCMQCGKSFNQVPIYIYLKEHTTGEKNHYNAWNVEKALLRLDIYLHIKKRTQGKIYKMHECERASVAVEVFIHIKKPTREENI
ncbi:zinc finger protein 239-like [Sceloporus undulatus]|uniref:zinc finger protein 239-like n=1 Tax=Sceloporus undulatus TaxID=8520 RepID=UPI001C4D69FF|nr:zinc finger protein 239-like [Sceloporus undulatus]